MDKIGETNKVNIAILGPFPPAIGGIATNIQNILESPLKQKYTFHNVRTTSVKYGTAEYSKEKIYSKLPRIAYDIFRFIFLLVKKSPQLIHINTSFGKWAFWRDSAYIFISKLFRKKLFLQVHGGELNEFWSDSFYLTKMLIRKILSLPEMVGVLSAVQRKPFVDVGLGEKVKIFRNTVDSKKFVRDKDFRKELSIPDHCVVVLFIVAHFYKEKGGMDLLKTIPLVTKKHKTVLFVFVGGGGEESEMLNFCRKMKIQNYVRFTGHLRSDAVTRLQLSADIYAFPTYYSEGLPLVILESMAAGLPIIATPIRAIPEVIEDGKNGFLIKPRDHVALAEKITWLIENEELRTKMRHRNIEKIREKYDLKIVAKMFEESYQQILSGNKRHETSYSKF